MILTIGIAVTLLTAATNTLAQDQKGKFAETMDIVRGRLDPGAIAGLNTYETDAMMKVLKVRRASRKAEVARIFDSYNGEMSALRDENVNLLAGLGIAIKDIVREKEFKLLWHARSDYRENVHGIREMHRELHQSMEDELLEVLTRRQERKWRKHQTALQKEQALTFDVGDLFSFVGF